MSDLKALVDRLVEGDPAEAPPERRGGLAAMLDPAGGVQLAEALAYPTPPELRFGASDEHLERQILRGLDAVERRLRRNFEDAFKARYRLPGAVRCLDLLLEAGVFEARSPQGKPKPRALRKATRTIWAPIGGFIETQYKRGRFDLRHLRADAGSMLRARGGDAARLEAIDGMLREATQVEGERRYRRALWALERRFLDGITPVIIGLPEIPTARDLEPAFGALIRESIDLGWAAVGAILKHERALLEGLLSAAPRRYAPAAEEIH